MPKATVTVRELKNKDTGVDVQVTGYKTEHGMLTTNYSYNILVVTNLKIFKSEEHKPTDLVQFVKTRSDDHFVRLRDILHAKFPSSDLPLLVKVNTLFGDVNPKERKVLLEKFLKKVVSCKELLFYHITLEFLGVDPIKAYNYVVALKEGTNKEETSQEKEPVERFETEGEYEDLFTLKEDTQTEDDLFDESLQADLSSTKQSRLSTSKLFQDQDFGGGVSRTDAPELFLVSDDDITQASETKQSPTEEDSDLLNVEEDIEKLLEISKTSAAKPQTGPKPDTVKKPTLPPKPGKGQVKPSAKPKPAIKPKTNRSSAHAVISPTGHRKETASVTLPKGQLFFEEEETQLDEFGNNFDSSDFLNDKLRESKTESSGQDMFTSLPMDDNLDSDDILKYIQQNSAQSNEDVDLFS